ncbi:MAG: radical SAM protein [Acidobacteriaceae bacterium]|nr:radical SAM protein [Acidobacteriaceae bacterium]
MLSVEITKECPLKCPGCYAYNPEHLGGEVTLRGLSEYRGEELIRRFMGLVDEHRPMHISIVGGEPLMRRRELDTILPMLAERGIFTLLVTSAVARVPVEWMAIPRLRVTVSVDGLPEHHDIRRKPATYERILRNIVGCNVNIHLTVTRVMLQSKGYLDEYFWFWDARPEVDRIWMSTYTPQVGEQNAEVLTRNDRENLFAWMPSWQQHYPKLLLRNTMIEAFLSPPKDPDGCVFSSMSVNYSADLKTRVEPCILGGNPDCERCGCAASIGMHALEFAKLAGPLKAGHLVKGSMMVGMAVNKVRRSMDPLRWNKKKKKFLSGDLVQIGSS